MVDYLVDTLDGPIGVLDGWERDDRGKPTKLVVGQGWFGRRRYEIPVDDLIHVDHEGRRLLLASGAAPLERSLRQRLIDRGRGRPVQGRAAGAPVDD